MVDAVMDTVRTLGCVFKENAPMSEYTSFKTGGPAGLLVMPDSVKSLAEIVRVCKQHNIKTYVIGNGSNLLVSDSGLNGVVIRLASVFSDISCTQDGVVRCGAGILLSKLCAFALQHSLSGLEFAFGIPGTAGGAAYMNAGAYGGEMKDVLLSCTHMDRNGNIGSVGGEALALGYRKSAYTGSDFIITELCLQLKKGSAAEIKAAMEDKLFRRKSKQPLEFPSAGSTFKRPEGYFAGALIEECGLKGCAVGGAQVSEKHAGFIINRGGATTADILSLIQHVQETVYTQKGVRLEPEVRYLD